MGKTRLSTEDGMGYNMTWKQKEISAVSNSDADYETWPFKHKDETEENYELRMNKIKDKNIQKSLSED